jgi:hypothetical protein
MSRHIPLAAGGVVLVDDADYEWAQHLSWSLRGGNRGKPLSRYAGRTVVVDGKRTTRYLHREIAGALPGQQVDHINGDGLDCRRENLRFVTQSQNQQNQRPVRTNSTTGARGVTWDKRKRKFVAHLKLNGRYVFLGYFGTIEEASASAQAGRKRYFTHDAGAR